MKPVFVTVTFQRGDTPRLAFRLTSRNVRSSALKTRPAGADVVEWTIHWPSGTVTRSSANGGLTVDVRTRVVTHPIASTDVAAIPAGGVPFEIRVINGDGICRTYAEGVLLAEGRSP